MKNYFYGLILFLMLSAPLFALGDDRSKVDSLKIQIQSSENDSIKIELLIQLSRQYHRANDHGDICVKTAISAVENALSINHRILYAKSLDNLGLLYRYHQQYGEALPLHIKAFDLGKRENIPAINQMIFANNAGVAARYNGSYDTAVKYYFEALAIATRENDKKNMEIACNGLGIAMMNISNREKEALEYLNKALRLAKESKNTLGQAMNYLSIAGYYDDRGQHTIAREYLYALLKLNEERDDQHGIAMTYQSIGNSFLTENKGGFEAQPYFEKSLNLFEELGNKLGQTQALYKLGETLYQKGDVSQGLGLLFKSLEHAEQLNNKSLIMGSAALISKIYEGQHNPKLALQYYKIAHRYKDSLDILQQETEVLAIKSRYDFASKEAEISLLTKDKMLKDAQLNSRGLVIFLMSCLVMLLFGFIFFQRRIRKIRKKAEEVIKQQKHDKMKALYEKNLMEAEMIATRMQVNPHFMFNSLSAIKYLIQANENDKALNYLVSFSRFIRMVLETSHQPVHSITDELNLLGSFLKLEANRFDTDFKYQITNDVKSWADRKVIPALLLQPFVENAIWHGLLPSDKADKKINIVARSDDKRIIIYIEDNGVGLDIKNTYTSQHKSMGHIITEQRITLYNKSFPDDIEWKIENRIDVEGKTIGTGVQVLIQIEKEGVDTHHGVNQFKPVQYN